MSASIDKTTVHDLIKQWEAELEALRGTEASNPKWEWKPVQLRLERLHALAHEIHTKKAQERAKWQP